jgi:hypothetical protein
MIILRLLGAVTGLWQQIIVRRSPESTTDILIRRARRSRAGPFDYRAREGTHGERRQAMINGLRGATIWSLRP